MTKQTKNPKGKPKRRRVLSTKSKERNNVGREIKALVNNGGLNLAWIKFIDAYIKNSGNGARAYKEVYGKDIKTSVASASATRLLKNVNILEELNNRLNVQRCTDDFITNGLMNIAVEYRGAKTINAAVKSFEILAKMKGLLTENHKHLFDENNPALFVGFASKEEMKDLEKIKTNKQRIIE